MNRFCVFGFLRAVLAAFAFLVALSRTTEAGERRFTFVYEADTTPPKSIEFETWVTWAAERRENSRFHEVAFRHEIEFGLTNRLQIALYLADWSYLENPETKTHGSRYQDSAVEAIYQLTSPTTDSLGSAIYGEVRGGDRFLELEGKAILQKNFGRFVTAYNATLEAEWEGDDLEEQNGGFSQTLGVSFEISPRLLVGAELLHEIELPEWSKAGKSIVYAGPNVSYRQGNWWATLTPLFQSKRVAEEAKFQTRLIFGVGF